MASAALESIKVLELGGMVSAPFCGKLLGDFGAEIVKIEPLDGDVSRGWGPFPGGQPHSEKSGLFFALNTNKRSVALDADDERAAPAMDALIGWADVIVHNFLPGRAEALGLTFDRLRAANPDIVVVAITPFGSSGPYAAWKGYDLNAFHLTATGSRYCGHAGKPPLEHGTFAADFYGGMTAATWGLGALYGRSRCGAQSLDVSCAEAIAATFVGGQNIGGCAQDGRFEKRTGVGMPLGAPATILPCKDGHVWMLALEPGQWNGLARAMGEPDWMQLEMFQDMFTRAQNSDAIYPLIEEWTMQHGKFEIMEKCQAEGVPVTAVFTVAEAAEHPHLEARDFLVELEHAELGTVRTLGAPFKLPSCPGGPTRPAPLLGEHSAEVLTSIAGLSAAEYEELCSQGVARGVRQGGTQ